jgi:hypothetical protein
VNAPINRAASIQSLTGLPLNKKAVAMMANAQTSDQIMSDVTCVLELGVIDTLLGISIADWQDYAVWIITGITTGPILYDALFLQPRLGL